MRILLVENHARFARIVSQEFLFEHQVTIVSSLAAARLALQQTSFDAVLIDYDLDDGKGDDLTREINTLKPRPCIIAVSSHNSGNSSILLAGADAVCNKMQFSKIAEVLDSIVVNK